MSMEQEKEIRSNKSWMWIILLLILLFLFYAWKVAFKKVGANVETVEGIKYVNCYTTTSDSPSFPKSWEGWLYSAPIKPESSDQGTPDSKIRIFSIKDMTAKTGESIFYRLQRTGFAQKEYVTGVKVTLEICNEANQTPEYYSVTNKNIPASAEKISATILHLHNNPKVFKPGNYRVDALMNIDGKWILTNRIDGVKIIN